MSEIRVTLGKNLTNFLEKRCKHIGVKKSEYLRGLIINDYKTQINIKGE